MRASSLVILVGMLSFTVSCAHQQTTLDTGADQAKTAKKIDKKETKVAKTKTFTCLVGKDKRHVTIDQKEKRCEVNYTKFGDLQQVAWAESTPAICDRAFNSIRSNIEGSGYKCADGTDIQLDKKEIKKPVETAANTPTK